MNILLTSVGRRSYLIEYFKKAFNGFGEIHACNSIDTYSLKVADEYFLSPQIYDRNYIDYLLEYCDKHKIKAIISLFDIDLKILAENKHRFTNKDIIVIVSSPDVIQICNDKWETYNFLLRSGFRTPSTYLDLDKVKKDICNGNVGFPLIVKPRWGMGSIGVYKANNEQELNVFYNKIQQEIRSNYLKYESSQDFNRAIIIQQFIPGGEFGLEVVNDLSSNYVATLPKKKIAMRAGETDQAQITLNQEFEKLGQRLSSSLKHVSNLDVDVLEDNNEFYILEMNARFGGQYPFSHLAGADLPLQIRYWLENKPTDIELFRLKDGAVASKEINIVME